jgi:hypothetical protein
MAAPLMFGRELTQHRESTSHHVDLNLGEFAIDRCAN